MVRCWRQTAFREEGLSSLTLGQRHCGRYSGQPGKHVATAVLTLPDATLPKGSRNLGPSIDSYYEFKKTKHPFLLYMWTGQRQEIHPHTHLGLKHTNAE